MLELNHDGDNVSEIFDIDIDAIKAGTKKPEDYPTRLIASATLYSALTDREMNSLSAVVEALTGITINKRSELIEYFDRAVPVDRQFFKLCAELVPEVATVRKPKVHVVAAGTVEEAIDKIKEIMD